MSAKPLEKAVLPNAARRSTDRGYSNRKLVMAREVIAIVLLIALVACGAAALFYSRRFARYERDLRFGDRDAKPAWKPFWHR